MIACNMLIFFSWFSAPFVYYLSGPQSQNVEMHGDVHYTKAKWVYHRRTIFISNEQHQYPGSVGHE